MDTTTLGLHFQMLIQAITLDALPSLWLQVTPNIANFGAPQILITMVPVIKYFYR